MSLTYSVDGLPYGFGWMSAKEVETSLRKFVKDSAVCLSFTELREQHDKQLRVLFIRNHFIAIINCDDGTFYFDSLGPSHLGTLLGFLPPNLNEVAYQSNQSASCGIFVSFIAAVFATLCKARQCTINKLKRKIETLLSPDTTVNEFNMLVFAATQRIGEEFTQNIKYTFTSRMVTFCDTLSSTK